jgi:hypothetical protein
MKESANTSLTTPEEEAARRSRRGYEYQDLIAASFCLQMLSDSSLQKVACETQDDVVLTWKNPTAGTVVEEFVQVKSDRNKQQWSVSQFCAQKKDPSVKKGDNDSIRYRKNTSIFEKNALRDCGKHIARFRIVTRADVNELRILTEPLEVRDNSEVTALAEKLEEKLNGNSTLTSSDIAYWVSHATWDVHGTDEAVFNDNFRRLSEVVQTEAGRLIAVADMERILHHLAEETRAMAMGKGRCGADPSIVTEKELRDWLTKEVCAIPHFLGDEEAGALLHEERLSLVRCETLWLALGVSRDEATALAQQPLVGARTEFFEGLESGFHWITASYGAGKSLAVERLFQEQVADFAAQRDTRVPIFLRATGVVGTLWNEVQTRLDRLQRETGSSSLFLVLDAIDESGVDRAQQLLHEAYELSGAWLGSTIIVTSTNLPFSFEQFQTKMPKLTDDQAAEIVSCFAQHEVSRWQVQDRLGDDKDVALMCVLLGLALRETLNAAPSRGELLSRVVEAARMRNGKDTKSWAEQTDILCRIAMLSTDTDGGPIRPSTLGITSMEVTPLTTSKLIAEEAGNLVFTVATMRLWFAAQALHKGLLEPADLVENLSRARYWQESLAIFIATADFESAARYFELLAESHPAIAAQVIANSTRRWGEGSGRSPAEVEAFSKRVRQCLSAWLRGIDRLAPVCNFTDENGSLLKLDVACGALHTVITFYSTFQLPPEASLQMGRSNEGVVQRWGYKESHEPSHIWRKTHEMVCSDLRKFIDKQPWELADPELFHEKVWDQITKLARVSRWFAGSAEWSVIDNFESDFQQLGMWDWICEKRIEHPRAFPAPHPSADTTVRTSSLIPSFYSAEAALAWAQSTYGMALTAYQRIVATYFSNFSHDLKRSAWWPCRLVGIVGGGDGSSPRNSWWIDYYCEPVESEDNAVVDLEMGDDQNILNRDDYDSLRKSAARLRPNAPSWYWSTGSVLNFHERLPSTELVRKWLLDDLESIGWGN